jgi:Ca2+-binding RTX toxin-like protein
VTIGISSSNTGEGTVSSPSLTFTSGNWNTPQTVTVTGVDDLVDDGDIAYTIVTGAATSTDTNYSGLNASDVSATNTDDDTAGGSGVTTITDNCEGGTALLITGTSGNDVIQVSPTSGSMLLVTINGITTSHAQPSGRIIVLAGAGNDDVQIASSISNGVWLYGQAGDDRLNASNDGTKGNVVIGGDGNDDLGGGNKRDILIGGEGGDKIVANAGDDILIAGYTIWDDYTADNEEALCHIKEEWNSSRTYAQRVDNLRDGSGTLTRANGSYFFNGTTVYDDSSADQIDFLNGTSGDDWFLFNKYEDKANGLSKTETSESLNITA